MKKIEHDPSAGIDDLKQFRHESVRAYLRRYLIDKDKFSAADAEEALKAVQTLAYGTGELDVSFPEMVLDSYVFRGTNWSTIAGGDAQVTRRVPSSGGFPYSLEFSSHRFIFRGRRRRGYRNLEAE